MEQEIKIIKSKSSIDGNVKIEVVNNIIKVYCNDKFLDQFQVEYNFENIFNNIYLALINKLAYIPVSQLALKNLVKELVRDLQIKI